MAKVIKSDTIKRKVGRPKFKPNYKEAEKLYGRMCTNEDVADWWGISRKTVERLCVNDRRFIKCKAMGMGKARVSLRSKQFTLARKGNVTMLIWLGKQYLEQSEQAANNMSIDKPLDINLTVDGKKWA